MVVDFYYDLGNNTFLPILFLVLALNSLYKVLTAGKSIKRLVAYAIAFVLVSYSPKYVVHDPHSSAVLVTGASTGIGHKVAVELSKLGYTVFATVRKEADFGNFPKSDKIIPIIMDTTKLETIKSKIEESKIPLVGLINNAGIAYDAKLTDLTPEDECKWVMEVNLWGTRKVTNEFLPMLRKTKGRILIASSILGSASIPMADCYPQTKWALNNYGHLLRQQETALGTGVSVSILKIGAIRTSMQEKAAKKLSDITECERELEILEGNRLKQFWKSYCPTRIETLNYFKETASSIDVVVGPHVHALISPKPLTEYSFGIDSVVMMSFRNILPDRIFDKLLFLATDMEKHAPVF